MKTKQRKKAITLGEFIASVYDAHGKRIGRGFVRLAIKAHLVGLYPMVKEWDNAIT